MFHNKNPKSFVFNFWGSLHREGGFFLDRFPEKHPEKFSKKSDKVERKSGGGQIVPLLA